MLENEYLVAETGVDPAEDEPSEDLYSSWTRWTWRSRCVPGRKRLARRSAPSSKSGVGSATRGAPPSDWRVGRGAADEGEGVMVRDAAGHATTYSGVTSTCRDLARVGHLLLADGRWRDEELLPALDVLLALPLRDLTIGTVSELILRRKKLTHCLLV